MLDLELVAQLVDHFIIQISSVVDDDYLWHPLVCNDIPFDESHNGRCRYLCQGDNLVPLSK